MHSGTIAKFLIVDGDEARGNATGFAIREKFWEEGATCKIYVAQDVHRAAELLNEHTFTAAVIHNVSPLRKGESSPAGGANGLELIKQIRREASDPESPIISTKNDHVPILHVRDGGPMELPLRAKEGVQTIELMDREFNKKAAEFCSAHDQAAAIIPAQATIAHAPERAAGRGA